MTSQDESAKRNEEFREFCLRTGFAILTWQDVEAAHFRLFLKMLGAPKKEVCSAVYHSVESFDSRHKMVGRMAHFFLQGEAYKTHRVVWSGGKDGGLSKAIKDANENRNKLAHYGLDFEVLGQTERPDGSLAIDFGAPRLQPYHEDRVSFLLGRTPDKPEHSLSLTELIAVSTEFQRLRFRIDDFQASLNLPPPQQGLLTLANLGRRPDQLPPAPQSQSTPEPKGGQPSE